MESKQESVILTSSDGVSFTVSRAVAGLSKMVNAVVEEKEDDDEVTLPLPNVKSQTLEKVIKFCEHHLEEAMTEIEKPLKSNKMGDVVQEWYATFVDVDQAELFELSLAANYMDIKPLLDLSCAAVGSLVKGRTIEEIRKTFNITKAFTPEEEARAREEHERREEA